MIKLRCKNDHCNFCYCVSEKEFEEYGKSHHSRCMMCGSLLEVVNLEEIIEEDLETQVKNNVTRWFRKDGIEATIELVERTRTSFTGRVYELYKNEIERRGFRLKGE